MQNNLRKLKYEECRRQNHYNEPLSRVCIDKSCQKRTIICAFCEQISHNTHRTKPLKQFISDINKQYNKLLMDEYPLYYTNTLQERRKNFHNILNQIKRQVLYTLKDIQISGQLFYNMISDQVMMHLKGSTRIKQTLHEAVSEQKITMLNRLIDNLLASFFIQDGNPNLKKTIQFKLNQVEYLNLNINNLFTSFSKELIKIQSKIKTFLIVDKNLSLPAFKWSKIYKPFNMKITDNAIQQTINNSNGQRFTVMQPSITKLNSGCRIRWGIKILKMPGWIGIGICLKSLIVKANYNFKYSELGHGSYLISNNGFSWSHSDKDFNSIHKCFHFAVNDIVYMEFDQVEWKIRFMKGKQKFQMSVDKINTYNYYPCVNMCNNGDKVEIVSVPDNVFN